MPGKMLGSRYVLGTIGLLGAFIGVTILVLTGHLGTGEVSSHRGLAKASGHAAVESTPSEASPLVLRQVSEQVTKQQDTFGAQRQVQIEQELSLLRSELRQVMITLDTYDERFQAMAQTPVEADPFAAGDDDQLLIDSQQREAFQRVESLLHSEPDDPVWSRDVEAQLQDAIEAQIDPDYGTLVNVECRSSLCRLESAHDDRISLDQFMQNIPEAVGWDHSGMVQIEEQSDGAVVAVLLVNREGNEMVY